MKLKMTWLFAAALPIAAAAFAACGDGPDKTTPTAAQGTKAATTAPGATAAGKTAASGVTAVTEKIVLKNPITTPSGLKYEDTKVGAGATPQTGQRVTVHYTGTLLDGTKFDSSRDRGTPFTFVIGTGSVIKGWDEGVATMKVGGKRNLSIPAALAYGARSPGAGIPPNSDLLFEVELLSVQ
ncbi:MAG: FKBP-type peptidyl-prolyl cis-trans isomerase [Anaerolineaceae bacterium]